MQSEIAEEESFDNTNNTIVEDENIVQEYNNNLIKDMMQEYNNDKISEDTTANDVGLIIDHLTTTNDVESTTDNSDNNGELTTNNSANDDGYNLRRNKRNYGKHIGKVDTANDFAFSTKEYQER